MGPSPLSTFTPDASGWVAAALEAGVASWAELLRRLPGVYPTDALAALRVVAASGAPAAVQKIAGEALSGIRGTGPERSDGPPTLPVPHPLDFEWRYAPATTGALLERAAAAARPGATVSLVGAPSLLVRALEEPDATAGRSIVLLDRSAAVASRIRARFPRAPVLVHTAGSASAPVSGTDVAVLDPPWYPPHTLCFLWTAALTVRSRGIVLLSLPPVGTRPGIESEREALWGWCRMAGLELVAFEEGALRYASPPFERNALAAAGLACPLDWRGGDLATLVLKGPPPPSARPPRPPDRTLWPEIDIEGVRIRFRPSTGPKWDGPFLRSIVDGDVLPSVSARDPRRAHADVWTSGNRVLACASPQALLRALRLAQKAMRRLPGRGNFHGKLPPAHADHTDVIEHAVARILEIAEMEADEYLR